MVRRIATHGWGHRRENGVSLIVEIIVLSESGVALCIVGRFTDLVHTEARLACTLRLVSVPDVFVAVDRFLLVARVNLQCGEEGVVVRRRWPRMVGNRMISLDD
jgi:hypothetical protein